MLTIVEYLERVFKGLKICEFCRMELVNWQLDELCPIVAICNNCGWTLLTIADKCWELPVIPTIDGICQELSRFVEKQVFLR